MSFFDKFKVSELLVKEYQYWLLSVRPVQLTLGSMVLSLTRECSSLGNLSAEETAELGVIFKELEVALAKSFNYDKINYLALMMIDDQVHFHIVPRYKDVRFHNEVCFEDPAWPGPIVNFSQGCSDANTLAEVQNIIRNSI